MAEALRDWRPPTLMCRLFCPRTLRLIHPEEDTCCCTQPCTRQDFFLNIVRVIMTTPPSTPVSECSAHFVTHPLNLNLLLAGASTSWAAGLTARLLTIHASRGSEAALYTNRISSLVAGLNSGALVMAELGVDGATRRTTVWYPGQHPAPSSEVTGSHPGGTLAASTLSAEAVAFVPTNQGLTEGNNHPVITQNIQMPASLSSRASSANGGDEETLDEIADDLEARCHQDSDESDLIEVVSITSDAVMVDDELQIDVNSDDLDLTRELPTGDVGLNAVIADRPTESVGTSNQRDNETQSELELVRSQVEKIQSTLSKLLPTVQSCSGEINTSTGHQSRSQVQGPKRPFGDCQEKYCGQSRIYPPKNRQGGYPNLDLDMIVNDPDFAEQFPDLCDVSRNGRKLIMEAYCAWVTKKVRDGLLPASRMSVVPAYFDSVSSGWLLERYEHLGSQARNNARSRSLGPPDHKKVKLAVTITNTAMPDSPPH